MPVSTGMGRRISLVKKPVPWADARAVTVPAMKLKGVLCALCLVALALTAPAAPAASSAGWSCVANDAETDWTLLATGSSGIPFMPVIPGEGPKVITRWNVSLEPGLGPIRQRLEVFEVQNEASEFKKLGESALETLVDGVNSFPTRIPVTEGDSVGLYGPEGTLFCDEEEGAISLLYEGAVASGETKPFKGALEIGTPIVVTVEDDADGDGYGDETQDGCSAYAVAQGPCPMLTLIRKFEVRRGAVLIHVTPTADAHSTQVLGRVLWRLPRPNGKKRTVMVNLSGGAPQFVPAGSTATFRVPLPRRVRRHLARLPSQRVLWARLEMTAHDVVGGVARGKVNARLRGRA